MATTGGHIVLLGDSIFANAAYTQGAPDVVTHLQRLLPAGSKATLLARDGARLSELSGQLRRVPTDASHLVISIGGNDVLQSADLLNLQVRSSADALRAFASRVDAFEKAYRDGIAAAVAQGKKTVVCTVYNGALEPERATSARMALALFNDAILRTAFDLRLDAIELRSICIEATDYVLAIEPSAQGGRKIAEAIARVTAAMAGRAHPARVWGAE